jgi:hypothetical protein
MGWDNSSQSGQGIPQGLEVWRIAESLADAEQGRTLIGLAEFGDLLPSSGKVRGAEVVGGNDPGHFVIPALIVESG